MALKKNSKREKFGTTVNIDIHDKIKEIMEETGYTKSRLLDDAFTLLIKDYNKRKK